MPRGNDLIRREIKTPVTFVFGGITKKNTKSGVRGKFVGGCRGDVGVAMTPEDSKVRIRGLDTKESKIRSAEIKSLGWVAV